jgi:hypothetical protein
MFQPWRNKRRHHGIKAVKTPGEIGFSAGGFQVKHRTHNP